MVARRPPPDSHATSTEEVLRKALTECEAKVRGLNERLSETESSGKEFLSDAAHAIRNPLTITHSYLEILHTDLAEGLTREQQSFLEIAYENTVKLRKLVEDLVELADLATASAEIDPMPIDVREFLGSVQAGIRTTVDQKGLDLKIEVADGLPEVRLDSERLGDAIRRLIENSVRYTPAGGSIALTARSVDGDLTIEIHDTGVGIPADQLGNANRAFVQLHRISGERRVGFGLGLPLSQRQVEAMGGSLELKSTEGEGTVVTIRIPVSEIA